MLWCFTGLTSGHLELLPLSWHMAMHLFRSTLQWKYVPFLLKIEKIILAITVHEHKFIDQHQQRIQEKDQTSYKRSGLDTIFNQTQFNCFSKNKLKTKGYPWKIKFILWAETFSVTFRCSSKMDLFWHPALNWL